MLANPTPIGDDKESSFPFNNELEHMAFFPDLSSHTYTATCGLEVVNIGWLDEGNAFPIGHTSPEFQAALQELCEHPIHLHRGSHSCWFCRELLRNKEGNGQIRVLGRKGVWYAAPTLVHHYVTQHRYQPPAEFVEAVIAGRPRTPFGFT
jgi:hypothetical protein